MGQTSTKQELDSTLNTTATKLLTFFSTYSLPWFAMLDPYCSATFVTGDCITSAIGNCIMPGGTPALAPGFMGGSVLVSSNRGVEPAKPWLARELAAVNRQASSISDPANAPVNAGVHEDSKFIPESQYNQVLIGRKTKSHFWMDTGPCSKVWHQQTTNVWSLFCFVPWRHRLFHDSAREAKVAIGYASCNSYTCLMLPATSCMHPELDGCTKHEPIFLIAAEHRRHSETKLI